MTTATEKIEIPQKVLVSGIPAGQSVPLGRIQVQNDAEIKI